MRNIFVLFIYLILLQNLNASDHMESSTFNGIIKEVVKDDKYIFDDNIKIKVPDFADNSMQVPIFIDGKNIQDAKRIVLYADYNPIQKIIDMQLENLFAVLSLNIKVAQETPLRVFILDDKNIWHISSKNIKSNGGGCDVSSQSLNNYEYEKFLGQIKGEIFVKEEGSRIKASIFHPMETGLVFGTTEFYINEISIKNNDTVLGNIQSTSVISENPRFIFETKEKVDNINIEFTDSDGNKYKAQIK